MICVTGTIAILVTSCPLLLENWCSREYQYGVIVNSHCCNSLRQYDWWIYSFEIEVVSIHIPQEKSNSLWVSTLFPTQSHTGQDSTLIPTTSHSWWISTLISTLSHSWWISAFIFNTGSFTRPGLVFQELFQSHLSLRAIFFRICRNFQSKLSLLFNINVKLPFDIVCSI